MLARVILKGIDGAKETESFRTNVYTFIQVLVEFVERERKMLRPKSRIFCHRKFCDKRSKTTVKHGDLGEWEPSATTMIASEIDIL